MSEREKAPLRVQVLATVWIVMGVYGAIDFVVENFNGPFHLNLGVFGLLLGPGLLRMREWARAWTVRLLLIFLVAGPLLVVSGIATVTGPWPMLLATFGCAFWGYRVLKDTQLRKSFDEASVPAPIGFGVSVVWFVILLGTIGERAYANRQEARRDWRQVERNIESVFGDRFGFQHPPMGVHLGQLLEEFLSKDESIAWMQDADERNDWLAFDAERHVVYVIGQYRSTQTKLEIWYVNPRTSSFSHGGYGFSWQIELEGVRLVGDGVAIQFRASMDGEALPTLESVGLVPGGRYEFLSELKPEGTLVDLFPNPLSGGHYQRLDD